MTTTKMMMMMNKEEDINKIRLMLTLKPMIMAMMTLCKTAVLDLFIEEENGRTRRSI